MIYLGPNSRGISARDEHPGGGGRISLSPCWGSHEGSWSWLSCGYATDNERALMRARSRCAQRLVAGNSTH